MIRVGLIGSPEREEIQRLELRLEERGAEGVIFDVRNDPAIRMTSSGDELMGRDLRGFTAFYVSDLALKPIGARGADGTLDRERGPEVLRASQRHLAAWTALLARVSRRAKVANAPRTWDLHGEKPFESASLRRLGVLSPATLATNDAARLVAPELAGPDGWIKKGLVGGYGYTSRFTPAADAAAARALLDGSAAMIQERVVGVNVRIFVVAGKAVGAAEIHTGSGNEVDSRRNPSRVRRITAPDAAQRTAETVAQHWGMTFAAVDFMRDEKSSAWSVLECNSAPFFVEFERQTGIAVSSSLADHLAQRGRGAAART
ncbi:MAG: hypothetical protein K8S98_01840 [Planctomycetes bacterium]|nr:hypothetical protein [Planctomycetota bacterium]